LKARQQQHFDIRYHKSDPSAAFYTPLCVYTLTFNKLQNVQDCDIKKLFLLSLFFFVLFPLLSTLIMFVCMYVCMLERRKNMCFVMLLHSSLCDVVMLPVLMGSIVA